jgi:hypothetical protein
MFRDPTEARGVPVENHRYRSVSVMTTCKEKPKNSGKLVTLLLNLLQTPHYLPSKWTQLPWWEAWSATAYCSQSDWTAHNIHKVITCDLLVRMAWSQIACLLKFLQDILLCCKRLYQIASISRLYWYVHTDYGSLSITVAHVSIFG